MAAEAIRDTLYEPTDPASAIVAINPANGAIRAMVSVTPSGQRSQFNLAAQGKRQAGSSFKTFALTEAIRRGIDPDSTTYLSAPFFYQPDPAIEAWEPKTYDGSYYGPSTVTAATLRSDNSVYARLTLDLGPENVATMARAMGIRSALEAVPSIGLGSNVVSVLDMASAYATLAAGGVYSRADGHPQGRAPEGVVDRRRAGASPTASESSPTAWPTRSRRSSSRTCTSGTGTRAYFGRPAAGKTGTTDDHTDAWFCGYTPTLATAVWVGYPNATVEMSSVHGISVSGGSFPAEIWNLFVSRALSRDTGRPTSRFPGRNRRSACGKATTRTRASTPTAPPWRRTRRDGHRTGATARRRRGTGAADDADRALAADRALDADRAAARYDAAADDHGAYGKGPGLAA